MIRHYLFTLHVTRDGYDKHPNFIGIRVHRNGVDIQIWRLQVGMQWRHEADDVAGRQRRFREKAARA